MTGIVATAETDIAVPPAQVWKGLTDPEMIRKYMFGTQVETDWLPGSPIVWKGDYNGRAYEDKGEIIGVEPNRRLTVTQVSPLTGQPDEPENYHTVDYQLADRGDATHITLSQDNNGSEDEAQHSGQNWETVLRGLKEAVEAV